MKRRPHVAVIAFLMPLLAWSVLSIAFVNGDVVEVPVVVVDYDGSELTRAITNKLDAVESVCVALVTNDKSIADSLIKSNKSFATIIFEPDFTKKIKQGKGGSTDIVVNGFNMIYSKVLYKAIAQVLLDESKNIQIRRLVDKGFSKKEASLRATPIITDIFAPGNPYFNYA
ncbi:MAG TPA: ABC transporter permease, partial [Candidatus Kapabacteria bacterium]|nr:ABC transporter permease [Candidatus Kapabacteria bacterium]